MEIREELPTAAVEVSPFQQLTPRYRRNGTGEPLRLPLQGHLEKLQNWQDPDTRALQRFTEKNYKESIFFSAKIKAFFLNLTALLIAKLHLFYFYVSGRS